MIIAIDGPAGSGKSTTARELAKRLGFVYLDTGAMYRAVAYAFDRAHLPIDEQTAGELVRQLHLSIQYIDGTMHVLLNGEDVSGKIRTIEMGALSSAVSKIYLVRAKLVEEQRRIAREHVNNGTGVVLDGRDIGTVVFPDADLKIYMVADPKVRAERRLAELRAAGKEDTLENVLNEIEKRDRQDMEREIAPLKKADDAVEIDTTRYSIQEQIDLVSEKVKERSTRFFV